MNSTMLYATAIAAALVAVPVSAQEARLGEQQVELYAEMLAMGEVCGDLADYAVNHAGLEDWINDELADAADSDVESILTRRDAKLDSLMDAVNAAREAPAGRQRARAIDSYYESLFGRCDRLMGHSVAGAYFQADGRVQPSLF
jgi:hypothetical protein